MSIISNLLNKNKNKPKLKLEKKVILSEETEDCLRKYSYNGREIHLLEFNRSNLNTFYGFEKFDNREGNEIIYDCFSSVEDAKERLKKKLIMKEGEIEWVL